MLKKCFSALLVLITLTALTPALAHEVVVQNQTYICERGVELPVTFMTLKGGDAYAVTFVEGKLVPMKAQPTASGVWYVALDEQDSYRLRTKGNHATLTFLEADDSAKEQTILGACEADVPKD